MTVEAIDTHESLSPTGASAGNEARAVATDERPMPQIRRVISNKEYGMSVPVKVVVVYHSGYGHTVKIAEAVARGAAATNGASVELVPADEAPSRWEFL